ncbi:MAG: hypothetical protein ACJ708_00190, partial [Nitrososphaeraceae archaeon]
MNSMLLYKKIYRFYYCSSTIPAIAFVILILFLLSNYGIDNRYFFAHHVYATNIKAEASSTGPAFSDPNLRAQLVVQGLSYPTSMAFISNNNNDKDILVLQKNNGEVRLVSNGVLKDQPVLKVDIDNSTRICCRGLLG